MLTCLILDDEPSATERLQYLFRMHVPDVSIVAVCQRPEEALLQFSIHKPDIVITDILMPGMNGLEFLEAVRSTGIATQAIVFSSSRNPEYMLSGYKLDLVHYLCKPILPEELVSAIDNAKRHVKNQKQFEQLQATIETLTAAPQAIIKTMKGVQREEISKIVAIVADKKICHLYTIDGRKINVNSLLKELEEEICVHGPVRVDRSHIVNYTHILGVNSQHGICSMRYGDSALELRISEAACKLLLQVLAG